MTRLSHMGHTKHGLVVTKIGASWGKPSEPKSKSGSVRMVTDVSLEQDFPSKGLKSTHVIGCQQHSRPLCLSEKKNKTIRTPPDCSSHPHWLKEKNICLSSIQWPMIAYPKTS